MSGAVAVRAYALISGGKDSMTLADVLQQRDMLAGVVAIDTGISVPDWLPFIRAACDARGWALMVVGSTARYDWLVRRFGFPGPGLHSVYMRWLKERGVEQFKKRCPGALLASGVRRGESKRRLGTVREWNTFGKMPIWAPLIDWTTAEVWAYMHERKLPRAPAYATLGISGDCLCGAFAEKNEREALADCYPEMFAERIAPLERETGGQWGAGKASRARRTIGEQLICVECDPSGHPDSGTAP